MKKRIIYAIIDGIVTAIFLFCFLSLIGCKTPIATTKTSNVDSINVKEYSHMSYEDIMQQIYSSLDYDFDYTKIKWSTPDSFGNQHIETETIVKGKVNSKKEEIINKSSVQEVYENDSTATKKEDTEINSIVKKLSWWQEVLCWIGGLSIVLIVGFVAYKIKR